jgi:exonuclease III
LNSRRHAIAVVLLCLSGTIELNPGPAFNLCTLNICSLNSDHSLVLSDIIQEHPCEVIALTETWITSGHTPAELIDLTPSGFDLLSCPRISGRGGGVAFLVRQDLTYSFDQFAFSSFEAISVSVKLPTTSLSLLNVYRPPDTSKHCQPFSIFLSDFFSLLTSFATTPHPFLITGDFNIHVDNPSDSHAIAFSKLLSDANLIQHVAVPTHTHNHTLDLVITPADLVCVPKIQTLDSSPSDHFPVMTSLDIPSL